MISIRSIAEPELGWFAALPGTLDSSLERQLREMWADGSSRQEWTLVAEADGAPLGRVAVAAEPMGGGISEPECRLVAAWIDWRQPDAPDAAAHLLRFAEELAGQVAPTVLDRRLNPEVHDQIPAWRQALEGVGYELFQEKEGHAWTDDGQPLPRPSRVTIETVTDVGRDRYLEIMAATTAGTLDRNDRYYIARCTPLPWAREILGCVEPGGEDAALVAFDATGDAVGFVLVVPFDEEGTGTIGHIGVVPEQRGRGYVDELLRAANLAARQRGHRTMLSDVDTVNEPMLAAMERNGHLAGRRAWHVWHYRLWLGAERPAEPEAASV